MDDRSDLYSRSISNYRMKRLDRKSSVKQIFDEYLAETEKLIALFREYLYPDIEYLDHEDIVRWVQTQELYVRSSLNSMEASLLTILCECIYFDDVWLNDSKNIMMVLSEALFIMILYEKLELAFWDDDFFHQEVGVVLPVIKQLIQGLNAECYESTFDLSSSEFVSNAVENSIEKMLSSRISATLYKGFESLVPGETLGKNVSSFWACLRNFNSIQIIKQTFGKYYNGNALIRTGESLVESLKYREDKEKEMIQMIKYELSEERNEGFSRKINEEIFKLSEQADYVVISLHDDLLRITQCESGNSDADDASADSKKERKYFKKMLKELERKKSVLRLSDRPCSDDAGSVPTL